MVAMADQPLQRLRVLCVSIASFALKRFLYSVSSVSSVVNFIGSPPRCVTADMNS